MNSLQLATTFLDQRLSGKYIHLHSITPILESLKGYFNIDIIGHSLEHRPIYQIEIGTGATKILIWSQMHGNESTTTKGLFDFLQFLKSDTIESSTIKSLYTIICIPILNPDGAFHYTRVNANKVDLNRDAFVASQPEMKVLHDIYNKFKPDFCYNLHDQRTIFGVDGYNLPATISFLAPAFDNGRTYNSVRLKAIKKIVAMNQELQLYIPNQVGRFDDAYNINCTGDFFTTQQTPTILFEAGFFQNDYTREESRKFVFIALFSSFLAHNENVIVDNELTNYLNIPQNNKRFFDFIYKNVKIIDNSVEKIINFAAQYEEILVNGNIEFHAVISQVSELEDFLGHVEYDCESMCFSSNQSFVPVVGHKADFYLNDSVQFTNGVKYI